MILSTAHPLFGLVPIARVSPPEDAPPSSPEPVHSFRFYLAPRAHAEIATEGGQVAISVLDERNAREAHYAVSGWIASPATVSFLADTAYAVSSGSLRTSRARPSNSKQGTTFELDVTDGHLPGTLFAEDERVVDTLTLDA